jgi:hypothetical protein
MKRVFMLKKDLPTIKSGRVIELSLDGKTGSPILMSIEDKCLYVFPIDILERETEWFQLLEYDTNEIKFTN